MLDRLLFVQTIDSDLLVRGRLLKGAALLIALGALVFLLLSWLQAARPAIILTLIVELGVTLAVFWMAHIGQVIVGGLTLSIMLVLTNVIVALTGTSGNPLLGITNTTHIFPVMIAGMVVGRRAIPIFGALPLLALGLMALTEDVASTTISNVIFTVLVAGLFWLIMSTLEYSLAEARGQAASAVATQRDLATQQEALLTANQELTGANQRMAGLLDLVRDLETPLIPVLEDVLVLPLVGQVDRRRAEQITQTALRALHKQRARIVIIDLTGVPLIDSELAGWIVQLGKALRLLGARVLLTGVRAELAQTIATQELDLSGIEPVGRLQDGIAAVLRQD
jgi:rsbT co-antagonist protein RsbR